MMLQTITRTAASRPMVQDPAIDGFAPIEPLGASFRMERDRALFLEGDPAKFCYKIISGAIRICKLMSDGRRQVSDFLLPGDLIGFDLSEVHGFTAEAIVESVVRRYPKPQIERLVSESPRVARQMLTIAYDRLALAQTQLVTLGRKTAVERLASFLVSHADRTGVARAPGQEVRLPMNRTDIADHLGLTVETVSRIFSRLKRDDVIDIPDAHSIRVYDWDLLDELSEGAEA